MQFVTDPDLIEMAREAAYGNDGACMALIDRLKDLAPERTRLTRPKASAAKIGVTPDWLRYAAWEACRRCGLSGKGAGVELLPRLAEFLGTPSRLYHPIQRQAASPLHPEMAYYRIGAAPSELRAVLPTVIRLGYNLRLPSFVCCCQPILLPVGEQEANWRIGWLNESDVFGTFRRWAEVVEPVRFQAEAI